MRKILTAAALGALILGAAPASAEFVQGTCSVTDVTGNGADANFCLNFAGNDSNYDGDGGGPIPAGFENYINSSFALLSTIDWDLDGKSDSGPDNVNDIGGDPQSGNWSVLIPVDAYFVVVLKASSFFAAYLFTSGSGITGGTFDVSGITTDDKTAGKHAGLSHLSVYTSDFDPSPDPDPIPLPGGIVLLLSGLAGLAGLARMRKTAARA